MVQTAPIAASISAIIGADWTLLIVDSTVATSSTISRQSPISCMNAVSSLISTESGGRLQNLSQASWANRFASVMSKV